MDVHVSNPRYPSSGALEFSAYTAHSRTARAPTPDVGDSVHYHSLFPPTYSTQEELFRPFPYAAEHDGPSRPEHNATRRQIETIKARAEGLCEQCDEASVRPDIRIYWRVSMSLVLPGNIPVAADSLQSLSRIGSPLALRTKAMALVLITEDPSDPYSVWASPKLKDYRSVWDAAATAGFVDAATEWGDNVDIDHVFPKSWANLPGSNVKYVRLFPVWAEINRSAGAGREKGALKAGLSAKRKKGIVYAQELQVLKILGHPVGTTTDPISIFDKRGKR